jgi:hypothetical protein
MQMAGSGFIGDTKAVQACSLKGVATIKGKIVKLMSLQGMVRQQINDAGEARSHGELIRWALFGLRVTKASCDATISIVAEVVGEVPVVGGKVKAISAIYSGATPMAENLGKAMAGQPIGAGGWIKAGTAGARAAINTTMPEGAMRDVVELQTFKSDIVVDAFSQDEQGLLKDVYSYNEKVALMGASAAGWKAAAKVYNVGKEVVTVGKAYADAYSELKANDQSAMWDGTIRNLRLTLSRLDGQILVLRRQVTACEAELMAKGSLSQRISPVDRLIQGWQPSGPTMRPGR